MKMLWGTVIVPFIIGFSIAHALGHLGIGVTV